MVVMIDCKIRLIRVVMLIRVVIDYCLTTFLVQNIFLYKRKYNAPKRVGITEGRNLFV